VVVVVVMRTKDLEHRIPGPTRGCSSDWFITQGVVDDEDNDEEGPS
jgi:hypothetical protein